MPQLRCDPTKALLHSAHLLHQSQVANRYGLRIPGVNFEWTAVQERVQQVIKRLRGGTLEEAQANLERQGIEVLHGEATFKFPKEILICYPILHYPKQYSRQPISFTSEFGSRYRRISSHYTRTTLATVTKIPDPVLGLLEDALVSGLGMLTVRKDRYQVFTSQPIDVK